jgi:hypothetical protein
MKKGLIKMSNEMYTEMWGELYIFFKDFRPTHIEFRHWENDTWYFYGVSDFFDEVKEGDAVKQYEVWFTRHPNGELTYKFQRYN